ncbi:MAG: hypothetical protein DRG78_01580 [Epsilonproteobacteria bacterium]|nr:MAG: hypothetical protein DRG78_01580 [Campylobacterota bacterium]
MKIVYISNSIIPSRNANSIHVMKMCQAFSENGHEVVLLAPLHENNISSIDLYDYYGVLESFKIEFIQYVNIPKLWSFIYAYNVYKYLKNNNFDIVFGRDLRSCFLSIYLNHKVYYESHKPYCKYNFIDKYLLKSIFKSNNFKQLIVISDALKTMYLKDNFKKEMITVAHDGADKPKDKRRIALVTKNNKLKLGYTGHLYQGRGIDIILSIASLLEEMEFHIVGGNQKDINFWQKKAKSNNVIFHGFVEPSEVYKYINSFDIMLAPYQNKVTIAGKDDSSKYMSPLKIFEYMSSQKTIILSDLNVLHEVLNNNEAVYVKYNDISEWVNAIKSLKDNDYRNKLSINAYNKFITNFTWSKRAKNVI